MILALAQSTAQPHTNPAGIIVIVIAVVLVILWRKRKRKLDVNSARPVVW